MSRFLLGIVVGVFLGVLVIAPNPLLSSQVHGLWAETRVWLTAALVTAEEVAQRADDMEQHADRTELRPTDAKVAR